MLHQGPNNSFERLLQGHGQRALRACDEELDKELVAPDFSDIIRRVQRVDAEYWNAAQQFELRGLSPTGLLETPRQDAGGRDHASGEEFDTTYSVLFASLAETAEREAQQLIRSNPFESSELVPSSKISLAGSVAATHLELVVDSSSPRDQPMPKRHESGRWLEFGRYFGVGAMAAAAGLLLMWSLPSGAWYSLKTMAAENAIAQFFSEGRPEVKVNVALESGAKFRPAVAPASLAVEKIVKSSNLEVDSAAIQPPALPIVSRPEKENGVTQVRARLSIADLERAALRAWKRGDRSRALRLYRSIIRRNPGARSAELAWGDIFVLLREQGSTAQRVRAWEQYLVRFPEGRFAKNAAAGLCRHGSESNREECWKRYKAEHPDGVVTP